MSIFLQSPQGNLCFLCHVSKFFHPLPIIQFQSPFIFLAFVIAASKCWYYFPESAVTNYRKLGDLEQWKFLVSQFWRPEVQNQFYWAKIKVLHGLHCPSSAEYPFLAASVFWWLAFLDLWLHNHPSLCLHYYFAYSYLSELPLYPSYKVTCGFI